SVITTNITRTARWDIARRGNIYAESYHNRKREKASGYIGSNPGTPIRASDLARDSSVLGNQRALEIWNNILN
ncbi:hypothetical protein, partial [Pantoea phytobeneficialis]